PFIIDGPITMDVWREADGAFSQVRFHDAATNAELGSFLVTTQPQKWTRVTFDTSAFLGRSVYIVLRGGTTEEGRGGLTLFDNIYGGAPGSTPGDPLSIGTEVKVSAGEVVDGIDFGNHYVGEPSAPSFVSAPPTTAVVGQVLRYPARAADADGDVLVFD